MPLKFTGIFLNIAGQSDRPKFKRNSAKRLAGFSLIFGIKEEANMFGMISVLKPAS